MSISRRSLLKALVLTPLCGVLIASAQQFPSRPIRFIVPASPGTSLDSIARYMAGPMGQSLNTSVVVENKVGANGIIGIDYVAKAPADGYTLLITAAPLYTNRWLSETPLPYDPIKDFTPVARVTNGGSMLLLVPANSPYKNLMDLVRDMRSRPGEVTYSSAGRGSSSHLCTVLLNDITKTTARHIPYKGAAGAVTDAVGGQVAFTCQSSSVAAALVKAGRLRALALSGDKKRMEALPDVPTVAEAGAPGAEFSTFIGFMAPARTPEPIVQRLSDEFVKIAATPGFNEFLVVQGGYADFAGANTFRAEVPKEAEHWKRLVELSKRM